MAARPSRSAASCPSSPTAAATALSDGWRRANSSPSSITARTRACSTTPSATTAAKRGPRSGTSTVSRKIRNPQFTAFDGKYYLHGRSGAYGEGSGHMILYMSEDGVTWDDGVYLRMRERRHRSVFQQHRGGLARWQRQTAPAHPGLPRLRRQQDQRAPLVAGVTATNLHTSPTMLLRPIFCLLPISALFCGQSLAQNLLPANWDPALAGDVVMQRLVRVTAPQVKGAHDAEFVCVGERAYIVEHDNDVAPGHGAGVAMYCVSDGRELEDAYGGKDTPAGQVRPGIRQCHAAECAGLRAAHHPQGRAHPAHLLLQPDRRKNRR